MKKILFILAAMLLSSVGLHAENYITYTAPEKSPGHDGSLEVGATTFGPAITSHEFSNGKGTITCAGEITQIGDEAFYGCEGLTSIDIPNSVTSIWGSAFGFCSNLTSIVIPNSVESIVAGAFMYCNKLTTVTIGSSVKVIGNVAFESCVSLKTFYCYADTPPALHNAVFRYVEQSVMDNISVYVFDVDAYREAWKEYFSPTCFKSFSLPLEVEEDGVKYEILSRNKTRVVAKDGCYTGQITILEHVTYQGLTFTVTEIGENAFKNCTGLTSVTIPFTVTGIGQSAFEGCNNLTSVTIPATVTQIGAWAFKNCTKLSKLEFAERSDAINIGIYAFENMAWEKVVIPDWMTEIPDGLFYNNQKLKAIYLHELVYTIGSRPFGLCPLEYIISMSPTPIELANGAFEGYNKDASVIVYVPSTNAVSAYKNSKWGDYFTNIISDINYRITSADAMTAELVGVIPDEKEKVISIPSMVDIDGTFYQVTGIGNGAFKDNTFLESISLPPTIQYIGDNAFSGCTQLKQTNSRAWEDLQTIGASAFYGCSTLDSIYIPDGVQNIGKSAFMECSKLTYVRLPEGLRAIPNECFRRCPLGLEIIVPEGVKTIGEYAFEGNSETRMDAESIALPSTLKEINFAAFYLHDGLKKIICRATIPPTLTGQAFAEYQYQKYKEEHITIYVPNRDVISAYMNSNWRDSIYDFKFSDLMAEEYKQYLNTVAGNNVEAQAIASAYCDSIDNSANSSQDVQDFTNTALGKIDKLTLKDYKQMLIDTLQKHAQGNIEAKQVAEQYAPQIKNAYSRQDAERLFIEADKKIADIFELIELKNQYITHLKKLAGDDKDLQKVVEDYSSLIRLAETKEEAYALYQKAEKRLKINETIKEKWKGNVIDVGERHCSTTQGYIDNH